MYNRVVQYMSGARDTKTKFIYSFIQEINFEYLLCVRQEQNFSGHNKVSVLMNLTEGDS